MILNTFPPLCQASYCDGVCVNVWAEEIATVQRVLRAYRPSSGTLIKITQRLQNHGANFWSSVIFRSTLIILNGWSGIIVEQEGFIKACRPCVPTYSYHEMWAGLAHWVINCFAIQVPLLGCFAFNEHYLPFTLDLIIIKKNFIRYLLAEHEVTLLFKSIASSACRNLAPSLI